MVVIGIINQMCNILFCTHLRLVTTFYMYPAHSPAVSSGPTRTEGTDAMGEGLEQLAAQAPAGRPATADEIAEAIVFLATDRASFIYGATLAVDGGRTAI